MIALYALAGWSIGTVLALGAFCALNRPTADERAESDADQEAWLTGRVRAALNAGECSDWIADQDRFENHHHNGSY